MMNNILLQSMTNTDTNDVSATVAQIIALKEAGADMVRVAVPGMKEVEALRKIKKVLTEKKLHIPLIADVHYLPLVAEQVASFVEKVRINPGNFTDTRQRRDVARNVSTEFTEEFQQGFEKMVQRAKPLIEICKKHNTTIRVGVNQGSLCGRIIAQYGNTTEALVASALEWMKIAEMYDFHQMVFSIKSSHVKTMMDANLLLYNKMKEMSRNYPLHLGVTEAANEMEGRVKSAVGIGALLLMGMCDTFRVSLTENPVNEIVFSKLLVNAVQDINNNNYTQFSDGVLQIHYPEKNIEKWWAGVGALVGNRWLTENIKDIIIKNQYFNEKEIEDLRDCVLQICDIKKTRTEIIACPSCGRTQYDIQAVLREVKQRFSNYPHLKIAVMGCVVNGPGEMADADYGIIGSANEKVAVYKGQKRISDFVSVAEALRVLQENYIFTHLNTHTSMISKTISIFKQSINNYHQFDDVDTVLQNPYPAGSLDALLYHKNWIDAVQWHLEDIIRNPNIDPVEALQLKRRIDASNQERTDMVEYLDSYFLDLYKDVKTDDHTPLNTETPAWAFDRLSILELKIFHMEEEVKRVDVSTEHIQKCLEKLNTLLQQEMDLSVAIEQLLNDFRFGRKKMKVYKQMKMYNDPNLNPVLYGLKD